MKSDPNDPTMPNPRWRVFGDRDYEGGKLLCVSRDERVALEAFTAPDPNWPFTNGTRPERTLIAPGDYVVEATRGEA